MSCYALTVGCLSEAPVSLLLASEEGSITLASASRRSDEGRLRPVARHRHVVAADQPRIRAGLVGHATRAGRDPRRAGAGAAGDAVDAGGVEGSRGAHRLAENGLSTFDPIMLSPVTATLSVAMWHESGTKASRITGHRPGKSTRE
jgi:hypothetical protein